MTVLFGFACPKYETCFIAGDSLEGHKRVTVDKVLLCWRLYAVAGYGLDLLLHAVQFSAYLGTHDLEDARWSNGSKVEPPDVKGLCDQASACLPRLVARHRANMERMLRERSYSQEHYDQAMTMGGGLLILDHARCKLHHARLKGALFSESVLTFDIQELESDHVWRLGINGLLDLGEVTPGIADKPRKWCSRMIQSAKDECARNGVFGNIGNFGANFLKRRGVAEFVSAFANAQDYLTAHGYPQIGK